MARVTDTEVFSIIDTSLTDIDTQIEMANNYVTTTLGSNTNLSATDLKYIEMQLAAHFVALKDPQRKSEKLGDAKDDYNVGKVDMGLNATTYGQQAILLDHTGTLASKGKRKASFKAIDLDL